MKEKSRILIPMLWGATGFAGAANVLRLFQNARINDGWYGSEGTAMIWGMYTMMASVNAVLWFIRYRNDKRQDETEE